VGSVNDELGVRGMNVLEDGKTVRVIVTEQQLGPAGDVSLEELKRAPADRLRTTTSASTIRSGSRASPTRLGRRRPTREGPASCSPAISAHIHYPTGGQGIQNGIQDAVNPRLEAGPR